tara:strand:- start:8109 stop:8807 length:699 start_codon:yes stop_codon:yes gene_type:complete
MKLLLSNARDFKRAVDSLRDLVHELYFHATPEALVAHAETDGVSITATFKGDYEDSGESFGISADALSRLIRSATAQQKVCLTLQDYDLCGEIYTDTYATRFRLATLNMSTPKLPKVEELIPCGRATLRTDHLRTLVRNLRHVERVLIELKGDALLMSGESDHTSGEIVTTEIQARGTGSGVYALNHIQHFLKSQHVSPEVTIAFWKGQMSLCMEGDITLKLMQKEKLFCSQ